MKLRLLITVLAVISFSSSCVDRPRESRAKEPKQLAMKTEPLPTVKPLYKDTFKVEHGASAFTILKSAGVPISVIFAAVKAAKKHADLEMVKAGENIALTWRDAAKSDLQKIEYAPSPVEKISLVRDDYNNWNVKISKKPVEIRTVTFAGTVENNLWDSAATAGMDLNLISTLADIFAWQIDFSREVRQGDRWRLTVEQKIVEGEFFAWGNILVAEYENSGELYTGIRYPQKGTHASYYFPDGSSLRRLFLKSPIQFGRITSRFTRKRFHPILKRNQAHNGVDYAAATGTPVMAVGDGRVAFVGRNGGSGKMVKIRHNATYETAYLHLNGFGKDVRKGSKVRQGQIIGYVGSTGLSTGPHLHFAFFESGRYVDPLGRKFPAADPVSQQNLGDFRRVVAEAMDVLPDWQLAVLTAEPKALSN